jgi:hypothetical protein
VCGGIRRGAPRPRNLGRKSDYNLWKGDSKEGNMPDYVFVYYGGMDSTPTPAQQKKSMEVWTAWFAKLGKSVVNMGAPTKPGRTVTNAGGRPTGKHGIAGYSIIKANNLGAAVNLAKSHPDVARGLKIGVYELTPM